jgi:hypothetical protein
MRSAEGKKQRIKNSNGNFREGIPIENLAIEASVLVCLRVQTNLRMSIWALQIELKWEKYGTTDQNKMVQSCTRRHHHVKKQLPKNRRKHFWLVARAVVEATAVADPRRLKMLQYLWFGTTHLAAAKRYLYDSLNDAVRMSVCMTPNGRFSD